MTSRNMTMGKIKSIPTLLMTIGLALTSAFTDPSFAVTTNNCNNIIVDKVWTGAPVGPTAISTPDSIFAVYYNQARYVTAAKIDLATCQIERKQLSSIFDGYDLHNYLTMTFDQDGILHISGNMHNVPLVYFRAKKPFDISSLTSTKMTNVNEEKTTYPNFILKGSNLYFMYRSGMSGDGVVYMNQFVELMSQRVMTSTAGPSNPQQNTKSKWLKVSKAPIFSNTATINNVIKTVSAYPSTMALGPDNFYHVAVDWRENGDVASNYLVNYVKTQNFGKWYDAAGNVVTIPISSNSALPAVAAPGPNKGLVNNVKMSFTASGKPVVLFTQYVNTANGLRNGIFASKYANGKWQQILLATSSAFTEVKGIGSLSNLPTFSELTLYGSVARMSYRFYGEPSGLLNLDSETLLPTVEAPVIPPSQSVPLSPVNLLTGLETDANVTVRSAGYQRLGGPLIAMRWRSLPPNNDKPFVCPPSPLPYCNPPPSDLVLDTAWPK